MARVTDRRDARLFVVATEDTYAVKQYFEILRQNEVISSLRVEVHVLETPADNTGSSPRHVIDRLNAFQADLKSFDERWLVLDTDRWTPQMLADVSREALLSRYQLAISNPCFDAWLLLHAQDGPPPSPCKQVGAAIRQHWGSFNKTRLVASRYTAERVEAAISRSQECSDDTQRWPADPGSHVHRLLLALMAR